MFVVQSYPMHCRMFSSISGLYPLDFVVQSLNHVQLFAAPWNAARQASLSFITSQSLLKLMSFELVMPSNHLILWCPLFFFLQSFPPSVSFTMSWLFASSGQGIRASASASVLPMNIQGWFPLGLTVLISLLSKSFTTKSVSRCC